MRTSKIRKTLFSLINLKIVSRDILIGSSMLWILSGTLTIFLDPLLGIKIKVASLKTLEHRRAAATSFHFYDFLKFCDARIPKGEDVAWSFPSGNFFGNDPYLSLKASYYLYPRNFRADAKYILVFDRYDYQVPEGFRKIAEYQKNRCLLTKQQNSDSSPEL